MLQSWLVDAPTTASSSRPGAELLARESRPALTRWLASRSERQNVAIDYETLMAVPVLATTL